MDKLTLEQKQQQFNEFFTIKHNLKVNMRTLGLDYKLPSFDEFLDDMPYAFRIAGEIAELESRALRPLRKLGGHAGELVEFLNHQSRKIDLMMSYILQQQDAKEHRFSSVEFGGGGITLDNETPIEPGTSAEMKIFLTEEAAAVYCLGEVIACQQHNAEYHISFIFTRIREEDQELLVRASLHLQTLQLRERTQQQKNEQD